MIETKIKIKHKQPRKNAIDELLNEKKIEIIKTGTESSDSDCIVIAKFM